MLPRSTRCVSIAAGSGPAALTIYVFDTSTAQSWTDDIYHKASAPSITLSIVRGRTQELCKLRKDNSLLPRVLLPELTEDLQQFPNLRGRLRSCEFLDFGTTGIAYAITVDDQLLRDAYTAFLCTGNLHAR